MWDNKFPSEEDLQNLNILTDFKLTKINFKQEENVLDLSAIQLVFSNGYATQFEEVYNPNTRSGIVKSLSIGPTQEIRAVSIKADGPWTKGIRLIDEYGGYILDRTWYTGTKEI